MRVPTQIAERVTDVVRRHLHATDRDLYRLASFEDDLGADSLAIAELTLMFEETFDIDISDEEAGLIRTVRDAIITVKRGLRRRGGYAQPGATRSA